MTRLTDVRSGAVARIEAIDPEVAPLLRLRLTHLGFRPGEQVAVVRRAPFSGPAVYRICDYDLCLRQEHAAHVIVGVEQ